MGSGPGPRGSAPHLPAPAGASIDEPSAAPLPLPAEGAVPTAPAAPVALSDPAARSEVLQPLVLPSPDAMEGTRTLTDANAAQAPLPLTSGEQAKLAAARAAVEAARQAGTLDATVRTAPEVEAVPSPAQLEEIQRLKLEWIEREVQPPTELDPALPPGTLINGQLDGGNGVTR